jgi:D-serine ammonia-lyase
MATETTAVSSYVGKTLQDVPTPSIVLDLAKVELNCKLMLEAAEQLGLQWRAHIKTHKVSPACLFVAAIGLIGMNIQTTELTRLQVGDARTDPARIIVSTIVEAENIVPLLKEYQSKGREVNVRFTPNRGPHVPPGLPFS